MTAKEQWWCVDLLDWGTDKLVMMFYGPWHGRARALAWVKWMKAQQVDPSELSKHAQQIRKELGDIGAISLLPDKIQQTPFGTKWNAVTLRWIKH